jgi:hypothetical protein
VAPSLIGRRNGGFRRQDGESPWTSAGVLGEGISRTKHDACSLTCGRSNPSARRCQISRRSSSSAKAVLTESLETS